MNSRILRNMLGDIYRTVFRWLVGLGFFGLSLWAAKTGYLETRITLLALSIPLFICGIIAVWKPVFTFMTRPFMLLIDSIFFPGGKFAKPLLNLKLPAYYINEERYVEALDEYEKILKHYPDETEAYERAIWLHSEIFHDRAAAEKLIRKAKRRHLTLDQRIVKSVRI